MELIKTFPITYSSDGKKIILAEFRCPTCNKIVVKHPSSGARQKSCSRACQRIRWRTEGRETKLKGYVYCYSEDINRRKEKRCRLVLEKKIGRKLLRGEHCHHINSIRDDDRPENLMVMTKPEHSKYHATKTHRERKMKRAQYSDSYRIDGI